MFVKGKGVGLNADRRVSWRWRPFIGSRGLTNIGARLHSFTVEGTRLNLLLRVVGLTLQ